MGMLNSELMIMVSFRKGRREAGRKGEKPIWEVYTGASMVH